MDDSSVRVPTYAELLRLDGQGFIVLGAGQGIGEQVAHALSQSGATVLCVDRESERAESVAAATGGYPCVSDITTREGMSAVFDTASAKLGTTLKGIVDVVGMVVAGALDQSQDVLWHKQFQLVLDHAWLALQFGAKALVAGGGSMLFIGSVAGNVPRGGSLLPYAASKAALHHLVRGAALELAASRIRVNAVAPGLTQTPRLLEANPASFWKSQADQIPLGRVGTPQDVAASVLFLSSALAAHITGTILTVDGGASLSSGSRSGEVRAEV
jgi:NAD(P)-dependent dehydrogenase (short-subunit alcohol dehydrogenase family)